ncbi:MAG: hypothetical protein EOP83_01395 [Verrucomicrobiaceae bacterium]|nr:MAG: hypothetical protein EOP83_01395 [Verrucomicrobiaceae bacterium]
MQRRNLLTAGVAAFTGLFATKAIQAAPVAPTSLTLDEATRTIIGNVRQPPAPEVIHRMVASITMKVMRQLVEAGIVDPKYVMTSAVVRFEGQVVEAKTRKLASRYAFSEFPLDLIVLEGIEDALARDMFLEIRGEMEHPNNKNVQFCPYQLVTTSGVMIDAMTFDPVLNFMTRYGTFRRV